MFFLLLLAWFTFVSVAAVYFLVRNQLVFGYRGELINQVDLCTKSDASNNRPWIWRWNMYNAVSYERMLYSVRRFRSFYRDLSFLDPNAVGPQTCTPQKIGT